MSITSTEGRDASPRQRIVEHIAILLGLVLAIGTLYAMWRYGWRDLYADQWRLYREYVLRPFPHDFFFIDNGHRLALPNLIRLLELEWFGGNQRLQAWLSMLFTSTIVALVARTAWRDAALDPSRRAAATLIAVLGIFWLSNARMLMHAHEAMHIYVTALFVTLIGLRLAHSATTQRGWIATALGGIVLAMAATLTFGTGMASFGALIAMLVVTRAPMRALAAALAAFVVAIGCYLVLPGGDSVGDVIEVAPAANLVTVMRWLTQPVFMPFLPFMEPGLTTWAPQFLWDVSWKSAHAYAAQFGAPLDALVAQVVVGTIGIFLLLRRSWRMWRDGAPTSLAVVGLTIAWFTFGAGSIIALSRLGYFAMYPGQVWADRYLPWPTLFWCGIALSHLAPNRERSMRVPLAAIALAVVLASTHAVNMRWSRDVQGMLRTHAVAVASDAFDPAMPRGETVASELAAGAPVLREAGLLMFAWPSTKALGTIASTTTRAGEHASALPGGAEYSQRKPAWRLHVPASLADHEHYVIVDSQQRVIGVARPMPVHSSRKRVSLFERDPTRTSIHPIADDGGIGEGVVIRFD